VSLAVRGRPAPWLALVMLILLGISATMFVRATRASRIGDDSALAFGFFDDDDAGPCDVPVLLVAELPRGHAIVDEVPLLVVATRAGTVISIAPKTSPPA